MQLDQEYLSDPGFRHH